MSKSKHSRTQKERNYQRSVAVTVLHFLGQEDKHDMMTPVATGLMLCRSVSKVLTRFDGWRRITTEKSCLMGPLLMQLRRTSAAILVVNAPSLSFLQIILSKCKIYMLISRFTLLSLSLMSDFFLSGADFIHLTVFLALQSWRMELHMDGSIGLLPQYSSEYEDNRKIMPVNKQLMEGCFM